MQRIVTPADLEIVAEESAYDINSDRRVYQILAVYREDRDFAATYRWLDQPFEKKRAEALEMIAGQITQDLACREQ